MNRRTFLGLLAAAPAAMKQSLVMKPCSPGLTQYTQSWLPSPVPGTGYINPFNPDWDGTVAWGGGRMKLYEDVVK